MEHRWHPDDDRDRWRDEPRRGLAERASDTVRSWFGDDEAERRRDMDERGEWRDIGYGRGERAMDLMSRSVETVHPRDSVEHAARLMRERDVGAVPVATGDGRLVGMITDRDVVVRLVARGVDPTRAYVHEAMTERAFACRPDDGVETCMRIMARHRVRRLPVVDDRGRIVGIVSQADLALHAGSRVGSGARREFADMMGEVSERSGGPYRG